MLLEVKSFVWKLVYASKSAFFLIEITIRSKLGIKISDQNKRIATGGGGSEKGQKSVTYYLNGPLVKFLSLPCISKQVFSIIRPSKMSVTNIKDNEVKFK
jgi:hypothetical protein